jgi:hypothetical protein
MPAVLMQDLDAFVRSYGYPAGFCPVMGERFAPIPDVPFLLTAGALAALASEPGARGHRRAHGRRDRRRRVVRTRLAGRPSYPPVALSGVDRARLLRPTERGHSESARCRGPARCQVHPGRHSMAQPLAGALGMRHARFLVFDLSGALLRVGLYVGLGSVFHAQLAQAMALVEPSLGGASYRGWSVRRVPDRRGRTGSRSSGDCVSRGSPRTTEGQTGPGSRWSSSISGIGLTCRRSRRDPRCRAHGAEPARAGRGDDPADRDMVVYCP